MKRTRNALMALTLAALTLSANVNASDGHHSYSVGFVLGGPAYWPYYGPPAYPYPSYPYYYPYYYPPVIAVPYSPPTYVERAQDEPSGEQYWYYCSNPQGYYPYVRDCKTNWQRVTPAPSRN